MKQTNSFIILELCLVCRKAKFSLFFRYLLALLTDRPFRDYIFFVFGGFSHANPSVYDICVFGEDELPASGAIRKSSGETPERCSRQEVNRNKTSSMLNSRFFCGFSYVFLNFVLKGSNDFPSFVFFNLGFSAFPFFLRSGVLLAFPGLFSKDSEGLVHFCILGFQFKIKTTIKTP